MIIRGGFNVYPREVEEVLYEHPAVAEAAVIGITDDMLGEEVAAVVTLKPGASATPDELREHVKSQLAAVQVPALRVDSRPNCRTATPGRSSSAPLSSRRDRRFTAARLGGDHADAVNDPVNDP